MNEPRVSITEPISSKRRAWNGTMRVLLYVSAVIICALLLFLIGYILYRGIPNLSWEFLTSEESVINDIEGILPSIVNTVYVIIATLIIVLPLGVGSAIYLTEYATNKKLVSIIEFATETLSGMPSIIFALVGMMVFCQALGLGTSLIAGSLTLFIIFRIIHGVSFGMVTVGGNTVVIDIMPSSRRGEGLGYYGLTNNIAMSIGPMFGLFLHDGGVSFATIFCYALGSCMLGFLSASLVKTPYKPPVKREPISLDRFILLKGMPAGLSLLLLSIPYGMTTNYVAMYAREIGIHTQTGFFFTFMAIGMAISRIFSGKLVDRGKITQVIAAGLNLVIISFFLLASCVYLIQWNDAACTILFFGIALLMGIGFGIMFPAFNTLFVNLAPNNQRGTATSTYLTSWDVGIGIGMLTGGYIAEICSFDKAYLFGACLTVVSAVYFKLKVTPHYHKNKLR